MRRFLKGLIVFFALTAILNASAGEKLLEASNTLKDMLRSENMIPREVLTKARAIVIIPSAKRVGLFIGAEFGEGVASIKRYDGSWSNPFFVILKGGSLGWQFGFESNSILLIFNTLESVDTLLREKMTLGVDASASAGPIAKSFEKNSGIDFSSEIFSYRKTEGLFIGVSLKGAVLSQDIDKDIEFYGNGMDTQKIVNMQNRVNSYGFNEFLNVLNGIR